MALVFLIEEIISLFQYKTPQTEVFLLLKALNKKKEVPFYSFNAYFC